MISADLVYSNLEFFIVFQVLRSVFRETPSLTILKYAKDLNGEVQGARAGRRNAASTRVTSCDCSTTGEVCIPIRSTVCLKVFEGLETRSL